jgi:hypothetical protein
MFICPASVYVFVIKPLTFTRVYGTPSRKVDGRGGIHLPPRLFGPAAPQAVYNPHVYGVPCGSCYYCAPYLTHEMALPGTHFDSVVPELYWWAHGRRVTSERASPLHRRE